MESWTYSESSLVQVRGGTQPTDRIVPMTLWTFQFRGGEPFTFQVPWNPLIEHKGSMSVAHILCSQATKDTIAQFAQDHEVIVGFWSEGQTKEQEAERVAMLGDPEAVYLTAKCSDCFWFDPKLKDNNFCGVEGWDRGFQMAGCQVHERAVHDLFDCPAARWNKS